MKLLRFRPCSFKDNPQVPKVPDMAGTVNGMSNDDNGN